MNWIKVSERLPTEAETLNGRIPIVCEDGELRWAMLVGDKKPWLMSEIEAIWWIPVPQLPKT